LTWTQHVLGVGLAFLAGAYARTRPAALLGLVLAAATSVACWGFEELTMTATEYAYLAALLAGAWIVGRAVSVQLAAAERTRRELADLDDRRGDLERDVVRLERRRVAREVHDLVGHGLSLVSVHAAVSARRLERGEGSVTDALDEVRELAAATQRELVALLEMLHAPGLGEALAVDAPGGAPDVAALVDAARRAGQTVELELEPVPVSPAVAAVIADVVREGLTNARKHAGAVPADVAVRRAADPGAVEVVVANAPGAPTLGTGTRSGLLGLAERVQALGGVLESGATETGGWRLRCALPAASAAVVADGARVAT
jgi:signal transduction histidine kinase